MSAAKSGASRRRKGGHEEHEEHVNHERWLVSYADTLTLLFVLFVVLYAMSNVDKAKFAQLAAGLAQGFGAQSVAFSGASAPLEGSGNSDSAIPIDPGVNPGLGGEGDAKTKETAGAGQGRPARGPGRAAGQGVGRRRGRRQGGREPQEDPGEDH